MTRPLPWLLVALGCATSPPLSTQSPAPATVRFLRLHLDEAEPGAVPALLAVRREYRGWVQQQATPPGEAPFLFLQLGDAQLWALRPAASWDEMPIQATADRQTEDRVRAAVGAALDENGRRMHGSIQAHHNEILRFLPELSAGQTSLTAMASEVAVVAVDLAIPSRTEEYEARAATVARSDQFHLVFFSSPGSGAFVHFLGPGTADAALRLPDASLVRSRTVFRATPHPELSALPPSPGSSSSVRRAPVADLSGQ